MRMATLEVRVKEVISGSVVGGELIKVQVRLSLMEGSTEKLRRHLPDADTILILSDITDWRMGTDEEVVVDYPKGITAETILYTPYTDGIWFDGDGSLQGGLTDVTLADGWGDPRNLKDLEEELRAAAERG